MNTKKASAEAARRTHGAKRAKRARQPMAIAVALAALIPAGLACLRAPWVCGIPWLVSAALLAAEAILIMASGRLRVARIAVGVAALALFCAGFFVRGQVLLDGKLEPGEVLISDVVITDAYPQGFERMENIRRVDMRDSTVTDFTPLLQKKELTRLDARGNYAFTRAEKDRVQAALPACDILWSMPVGGAHVDSDVTEVDLTAQSLTASQIQAILDEYPDVRFTYKVALLGSGYDPDAEALDLRGKTADADAIDEALTLLRQVREIDLRGNPTSADVIAALTGAHPDVHFIFTCDVPFGEVTTEDEKIALNGGSCADIEACLPYLPYMPNLTEVDARSVELTSDELLELSYNPMYSRLLLTIPLYGGKLTTWDTELNLDNVPMDDTDALENLLWFMPRMRRVSMCDTGLSEAQMAGLVERHPDIKFVWYVEFSIYRVRTDATVFTTDLTSINTLRLRSSTFVPLKYCTDLKMLDIGHCEVDNIDGVARFKDLHVLILADNNITSLEALRDLDELEYVEMFLNDIRDLSPLADKKNLKDLNLMSNPHLSDITPLAGCTSLERLWIGGCSVPQSQIDAIQRLMPNLKVYSVQDGGTGGGWREHPRYQVIRQMYETRQYVPFS